MKQTGMMLSMTYTAAEREWIRTQSERIQDRRKVEPIVIRTETN